MFGTNNTDLSTHILSMENNPWGNPKNNPKNIDDILNHLHDIIKKQFFKQQHNARTILLGILIAMALWLATGFYSLDEGEQAVVLRFGSYVRMAQPGPNYHLPEPFERVIVEKVLLVEKEEIGFRSTASHNGLNNSKQSQREIPEEALMLTGDENIVNINFQVQWKIKDLKDYVFNVNRPKETIKSAAESAMREIISTTPINDALRDNKAKISFDAMKLLQKILDNYSSGVDILNLQILRVDPPADVMNAFRDVKTAETDKERVINEAESFKNDIIPRARGDAERIIQEAEAYKQEVVAKSTGEASRFNATYEQYKLAKDVTKKRIYLETMEKILTGANKTIIDSKNIKGVVPYLPLSPNAKSTIQGQ